MGEWSVKVKDVIVRVEECEMGCERMGWRSESGNERWGEWSERETEGLKVRVGLERVV